MNKVEVITQDGLPIEGVDTEEFAVVAEAIAAAIEDALDSVTAPNYLSDEAAERFEQLMDAAMVDFDIVWGGPDGDA